MFDIMRMSIPMPDYGPGDEVEYIGPPRWLNMVGMGKHVCEKILPFEGDVCLTHMRFHRAVAISNTTPSLRGWCSLNWRKKPPVSHDDAAMEIERMKSDPVAFLRCMGVNIDPWQWEAIELLFERFGGTDA